MLDVNVAHIPQELQELPQWLIWRAEMREGSSKPTKVPYQARHPYERASSTNPATWAALSEALMSAQLHGATGIGFVFSEEDPFCGIDVDKLEMVEEITRLVPSYAEWSPSGRGVHVICRGKLERGFNNQEHGVEAYDQGRYFCFTGNRVEGSVENILRVDSALATLVDRFAPKNRRAPLTHGLGYVDDSPLNRRKFENMLTHRPAAVEGDYGDDRTYFTAGVGKDLGLSPEAVCGTMMVEGGWNERCSPPWDREGLMEKINSVFRNGINAPGCMHSAVALGLVGPGAEETTQAPEPLSSFIVEDTSDLDDQIQKPEDGSVTLAELEDALGILAPSDITGVEQVLRQAVYLDSALRRERIITALSAPPFSMSKQSTRQALKDYAREAIEQLPSTGITWQDVNNDGDPLATADNLMCLFQNDGINLRWNQMNHTFEYELAKKGAKLFDGDVDENLGYAFVKNQCYRYGMPVPALMENLQLIAKDNEYHPFLEYLDKAAWDGKPRVDKVIETLKVDPRHLKLRKQLVLTWLISVVAAVRGYGDMVPKGVLVLVGEQSIGKTSWLRYLIPREMFGEGLHLDPNNKDSLMKSTRHLVCELGELDGTFNRADINALKSHISSAVDEYRKPYDRGISKFPRQTVYAGTVNNAKFLQDDTGNVRFWPITITDIDLDAMQSMRDRSELLQMWLEVEDLYKSGQKVWYFTRQELDRLLAHIDDFREISTTEEMIQDLYAWDDPKLKWREMTITQIKAELKIDSRRQSESPIIKRVILALSNEYRPKVRNFQSGHVVKREGRTSRIWLVPPLRSLQATAALSENNALEFESLIH